MLGVSVQAARTLQLRSISTPAVSAPAVIFVFNLNHQMK